jgi:hypothetical protein
MAGLALSQFPAAGMRSQFHIERSDRMPPTFTLKGKITDAATGLRLPNALVKIVGGTLNFGKSAVTNSSGRYKITGVKPEKIILEAALAYKPLGKMKVISTNTTIDFKLTKS